MENDVVVVLHGFFQLPNLSKLKIVEAINEYFDSLEKDAVREKYDRLFNELLAAEAGFECKCCGRR